MFYKAIISALGLLFLIHCNARKDTNIIKVNINEAGDTRITTKEGEIIYFNQGENKFLKEYQMNVTFKNISEDSRCPKDVNCIWAGVAVAQVEVMGTATRPVTLQLATMDNTGRNYHNSADFNGYTISLADVNPYPGSQEGTKALNGKYKIGIIIKKNGTNTTRK